VTLEVLDPHLDSPDRTPCTKSDQNLKIHRILIGPVENHCSEPLLSLPKHEGADESVCNFRFRIAFENR